MVRFWQRLRRGAKRGTLRAARPVDTAHLETWAAQRRGVEAYLEPRTFVTDTTVMLIAHDGEWTRRRIDGADGALRLGRRLRIPVYDVAKVGYPQRMRDYTHRQKILRKRAQQAQDAAPPAEN